MSKEPQVSHVNKDFGPVDIASNKYVDHPSIFKISTKGTKETFPKNYKSDPLWDKNYRPTGLLPTVSNIFERIMQNQIIDYMNQYLLLGYVNTEKASLHKRLCFISLKNETLCMIKKLCATLIDLSKAFEAINYELWVAALNSYGFSKETP